MRSAGSPDSSLGMCAYGKRPVAMITCRANVGASSANSTLKPPSSGVTFVTVRSRTSGTSWSVNQSAYPRKRSSESGPTRSR